MNAEGIHKTIKKEVKKLEKSLHEIVKEEMKKIDIEIEVDLCQISTGFKVILNYEGEKISETEKLAWYTPPRKID